jgi:hypothetical protein
LSVPAPIQGFSRSGSLTGSARKSVQESVDQLHPGGSRGQSATDDTLEEPFTVLQDREEDKEDYLGLSPNGQL